MTYFTYRLIRPISALLMASTLGILSGCSTADQDAETLAKTTDGYAPTTPQAQFDPQASRNNGSWGAVYMTEAELNDKDSSVVDFSGIAPYQDDPELDKWKQKFGEENSFATTDGKKLYHDSCAGCHMHQGEGAFGAGYYPPLANNTKMDSKYYIIDILINGLRGMPSFDLMMNDQQLAAVTQYVMNDLNNYNAEVTEDDVIHLRPDQAPVEDER